MTFDHLSNLLEAYRSRIMPPARHGLTEAHAILITYGDQVREEGVSPLLTLSEFCHQQLKGVISGIHILPFYPYSSDDGFSVIDYYQVNPALVTGGTSTSNRPFSELTLSGELQRLDQPLIVLVGAHFYDHDDSSANVCIAKYGAEYVADSFQDAMDYFGCGRTFVDDDEMDSGKSRLQYTITIYPNACARAPEVLP